MSKNILSNAAILAVVQLANYAAPFVILQHLTKALGLEIYGVLAFAQGLISVGFILVDFGYGMSATNKVSKHRKNKGYLSKILGGTFLVKIIIYIFCAIAISAYAIYTEKYADYSLVFILSLFPLLVQSLAPLWFFHGLEKMKHYATVMIFAKIIFASMCVLYIESAPDFYLVPIFNGISQLLALVGSIAMIYKLGYKIKWPTPKIVAYCIGFSRKFFVSRMAVASYMNGGVVILGLSADPAVTAVYSMAEQIYKVMQTALGPAAAAAYPYMANKKDAKLMIRLVAMVTALAFVGALLGYLIIPKLLPIVFDEAWLAAIPVINVFFVAIVIHAATVMMGYPFAALLDRLDVANSSVVIGALVYFILLSLLYVSSRMTASNLAQIMIVSELCVLSYRSLIFIPQVKTQIFNQTKRNQNE